MATLEKVILKWVLLSANIFLKNLQHFNIIVCIFKYSPSTN